MLFDPGKEWDLNYASLPENLYALPPCRKKGDTHRRFRLAFKSAAGGIGKRPRRGVA